MHRWQEIRQNPALREKLEGAREIKRLIREWFSAHGFCETETPVLVRYPGQEPYLEPFVVTVKDEGGRTTPGTLITSPEYALKKMIAAGFDRLFELSRCFRNGEPVDELQNPEFTMLEWYRAGADYRDIMEDAEQLVFFISQKLLTANYQPPTRIDFTRPWERLSVAESFRRYAGVDLNKILETNDSAQAFRKEWARLGGMVQGNETFEECFFKIFISRIEKNLGREKPTFLFDYPAHLAALARLKASDPRYAERFELYIKG
ncbi:EF-P lysine aminoacylase GenX, partial [Candidatus Uhrbacteria bacterium]|nr:EF-P lysine aminoacylase GenX [Candidatus Uhrbacteria bacterium]